MIQVAEQKFYHIHRLTDSSGNTIKYSDLWEAGNTLQFGTHKNLLYDRIFGPEINIEFEKSHIKGLINSLKIATSEMDKQQIQDDFFHQGLLFKYLQLTREIVLEETRKFHFPDKPSRLEGVWLSDPENIKKWLKISPKSKFSQKVFLVKFTGKVHIGDARWITHNSLSFDSYYKNALGYWNGLPQSKRGKPTGEYIGIGSLKIVEEIM